MKCRKTGTPVYDVLHFLTQAWEATHQMSLMSFLFPPHADLWKIRSVHTWDICQNDSSELIYIRKNTYNLKIILLHS